ncbi:hypothetical protein TVAG_181340 [Trichomonas vaginalis G3]|uniref:Uncharacterized protein n=1 Tax=Trichomonas vaginalis (strain ATCC PRA-98 / G3) TaxID=412133 RepID=A2FP38_TRIV3|nr:hypothetical protein TVAGG3_0753720 [Trichomonas vaginalis G3]EAX93341.1 hypothetical protein TVAG_181340 [Trichomonas vaginalis G3]KAI5512721.1 hypothetical protein TVAGG3_0753720 [Trichomonas vaginalis G3]|eukprot:XP_001306271.1 hypothetical protein [Trichomonas vaginalis G3]
MVKYNDGLLQVEHDISLDKADANRSIIADCLQNERYDYFNILFDLGLCYFNGNFQNPLSYLVYYDVSDLDLYEKVYQMTQRSSHARFELLDYAFPKILSNMDLLKFFVERKIYDPQLEDIMVYCGVEEMKYVFDQSFHLKKFNEIFADRGNLCFKSELIFYIIRNYQVKLEDKNGFNLMKNAFYHAHIELMKFLLDKYVMLTCKDKNDFYDFNKRYNWNRYYGQESKEENYDEEFDDPKFIFYNVMDNSIHTNIEAFELILENGGNANARGKDGFKTILDYHAYEGHFEIVKILAEHGAKITETTFEKCKDYNSFYCLIDNAKTN